MLLFSSANVKYESQLVPTLPLHSVSSPHIFSSLAYCMGHFDGYKNQYIKLEGAAPNVPTSNTTSNPPGSNTTTPATISLPTTYSWVGPFIIVVIVVILIAALVQKITLSWRYFTTASAILV